MADTFIFVRHGQSQANADKIIADAHSPLTNAGRKQAVKTSERLRNLDIRVIVTSPFVRARQTAETIAKELSIDCSKIRIIEELRERGLGELENNPKRQNGLWYFTNDTADEIEPRRATLARMRNCVEQIKQINTSGGVLVVGHAVSGYYLIEAAKGKAAVAELSPPSEISNADFAVIHIEI